MSPVLVYKILKSCKTELKVVLITLAILVALPIVSTIAVANAGVQAVSNALVNVNPITHLVEVRNAAGEIIARLTAATTWPVKGYVSEEFGVPHLPWQVRHTGMDIASRTGIIGDPITTFMAGKVTKVDTNPDNKTGYGKYVVIDHGHNITSLYGHMSEVSVREGQDVKPGDLIGKEGMTGHATGPHVHFEVKVFGIPVNPRAFMVGEP